MDSRAVAGTNRMECAELSSLLPAFADGEIVDAEREEVEAHLASCEPCREAVEAARRFRSFLKEKAAPSRASDLLRARIRQDVARERSAEQAKRFGAYLGVAAGLAVVASGGWVLAGAGPAARPEALVADAVDKHARALPVEVTPAAGDVDAWFQGKVDFHVQVPRFRSANAPRLVGARLANVSDRQAAYVVYGKGDADGARGRRMTVLVYPGEDVELPSGRRAQVNGRDVVLANQKGYNVALWSRRGVVYSLVSDLDERDVLELVSEVEER